MNSNDHGMNKLYQIRCYASKLLTDGKGGWTPVAGNYDFGVIAWNVEDAIAILRSWVKVQEVETVKCLGTVDYMHKKPVEKE